MKILAGIVLFNPDVERLKENINAVYDQVDSLLLVNNGSDNRDAVLDFTRNYDRIEHIDNKANLGIATALKQIMMYAEENGYDWVLTLDQDSVCMPGLIEHYLKYVNVDHVGILTCNIIDRNFVEDSGFAPGQDYAEIRQCITSGSFMKVDAYRQTDGYDEWMFIDSVDYDICINMRRHGFKIIKVNFDGVLHEVGHGRNVNLMFKKYISYNHNVFRQYYMARNHMYLVDKYPEEYSKWYEWLRELRMETIILIYETNKINKLRARWRGLRDAKSIAKKRHYGDTKG